MGYKSRESIGFWKNSLVRRFFLLSLLVTSVPLLVTVIVYDRMTAGLVADMAKERTQQALTQIKSSMYHFSRQHSHALEAISELPQIVRLFDASDHSLPSQQTLSLIHFDIDRPEIYGALFFDANWQLVNALPGQSASGYPYWGEGSFEVAKLTQTQFDDVMFIGPQLASPGKSAWYLLAKPIYVAGRHTELLGYLAFQLRLASLTEFLSSDEQALLCLDNMSGQSCFDSLGRNVTIPLAQGHSEVLVPQWNLVNQQDNRPLLARDHERLLMLMMSVLVLIAVTSYFYYLVKRVRRRVFPLIDAANAISVGEWSGRIPDSGNDEISLLARAFNRMTTHLDSLMLARGDAERKAVWGEFATGIAHEIRNPLATIKVCVQTLQQNQSQDRELQTLMVGEIDRINHLISDLLEYARPPDPETRQVSLTKVAERLGSLIAPMAKEKGINLKLEYQGVSDESSVEADENQLQQILMNLLINAIDASNSAQEIILNVVCDETSTRFVVSDQGCGMTAQQLDNISQPFYTTKTTGTGLGLSVSQRLAEMNGAKLTFISRPGEGTQAILSFKRESFGESRN